jgi:hypothetical protein
MASTRTILGIVLAVALVFFLFADHFTKLINLTSQPVCNVFFVFWWSQVLMKDIYISEINKIAESQGQRDDGNQYISDDDDVMYARKKRQNCTRRTWGGKKQKRASRTAITRDPVLG